MACSRFYRAPSDDERASSPPVQHVAISSSSSSSSSSVFSPVFPSWQSYFLSSFLDDDERSTSSNHKMGLICPTAAAAAAAAESSENATESSTSSASLASVKTSPGECDPPSPWRLLQPALISPTSCECEEFSHGDESVSDLLRRTGYNIVQRNGQRIYGSPPPNWKGEAPGKGTEVFVGSLPRNCLENEIIPLFETVGKIYECRLMMDLSGTNRGFCFIRFCTKSEANRAVQELNQAQIRPGKHIGVVKSVDNCKLWVSGIPKNCTAQQIKNEIEKLTNGVKQVHLYPSQTNKSRIRSYAFVEFESHRAAALARRKLVPQMLLLGQDLCKVDWAEPEIEVDDEALSTIQVLYVRNLMPDADEETLALTFNMLSGNDVECVRKRKDFAFVHFKSHQGAELALNNSNHLNIKGSPVEVQWSRPVNKYYHNTRKQLTKILSTPTFLTEMTMLGQPAIRGIPPRARGAAGIKGLGAPGSPPPKNLLRTMFNQAPQCQPLLESSYLMANGSEIMTKSWPQALPHHASAFSLPLPSNTYYEAFGAILSPENSYWTPSNVNLAASTEVAEEGVDDNKSEGHTVRL